MEVSGGDLDVAHRLQLGAIVPRHPAHLQEVGQAEDGGQRRAQLVLHGAEEIGLEGVELAQSLHCLPLLLEEAGVLHGDRCVVGKDGQNLDVDVAVDLGWWTSG